MRCSLLPPPCPFARRSFAVDCCQYRDRSSNIHCQRVIMPCLDAEAADYRPPLLLRNGHVHTIYGSWRRPKARPNYVRERLELPDGDFVDLDWSRIGATRIAIVCHGLESSSDANYMRSMVGALNSDGWDACAYNMRGCSGVPNHLLRAYHSGDTVDLQAVLAHVGRRAAWTARALVGFSLGGNLALKYVGERGDSAREWLDTAAAVSSPIALDACAQRMDESPLNIYRIRFVRRMAAKVRWKKQFTDLLLPAQSDAPAPLPEMNLIAASTARTFAQFDGAFTAPVNGYPSALAYWQDAASLARLPGIRLPTLLLNAHDDPLLTASCFPAELARQHDYFTGLFPRYGGHVAFVAPNEPGGSWHERRVLEHLSRRHG